MNLLEIFETGIVSNILPSDVYAILMLITTSKTVKIAISGINHNDHKVDVNLKKSENLLDLYDFSEIIKNISNKFTINKLYLQNCIIQKTFITRNPKNFLDSYENLKSKNAEDCYIISYLDIIFKYCPSLTLLNDRYYSLFNDRYYPCEIDIIKFKCNMPNCQIYINGKSYESFR